MPKSKKRPAAKPTPEEDSEPRPVPEKTSVIVETPVETPPAGSKKTLKKRDKRMQTTSIDELNEIAEKRERLRQEFITQAREERERLRSHIDQLDEELKLAYDQKIVLEQQLIEFGDMVETEEVTDFESAYNRATARLRALEKEKARLKNKNSKLKKMINEFEQVFFPKIDKRFEPFVIKAMNELDWHLYINELDREYTLEDEEDPTDDPRAGPYDTRFRRCLFLLKRSFRKTFEFRTKTLYDEDGFRVRRRKASGYMTLAGWINEEVPIFIVFASARDAEELIDASLNAQQFYDANMETLEKMVWYYRFEAIYYEKLIHKAESFMNDALDEYDTLEQEVEYLKDDWFEKPQGFREALRDRKTDTTKAITKGIGYIMASIVVIYALTLIGRAFF